MAEHQGRSFVDHSRSKTLRTIIREVFNHDLLSLEEKWLREFDVVDPFSGNRLEGFLSLKPDHRYGALAITRVNEAAAPQLILYETALTCALLFGVTREGKVRSPRELKTLDVPTAELHAELLASNDPVAEYDRFRAESEMSFRIRVLKEYEKVGIKLCEDKGAVMRARANWPLETGFSQTRVWQSMRESRGYPVSILPVRPCIRETAGPPDI